MRLLPVFALLSLIALPSGAAIAADAKSDGSQKVVCKSRATTGSRFQKRTCRTKAEWDALEEQMKRDVAEQINRPRISIEKGN